jgi:glycogen synthase
VAGAAAEAMNAYRDTARWRTMMVEAMGQDFSWARSAARYSALYRSLQGS